MTVELDSSRSGRDHYDAMYRAGLEDEAEWLRRGAAAKADTVAGFVRRHAIAVRHLVELGAGTGAVIRELQRRQVAERLTAIDYSAEAVDYLRRTTNGIAVVQADITTGSLAALGEVDLVVLSHVVEHLEAPETFLRRVRETLRFRFLVIEVPLEDLPGGRLKGAIIDRRGNPAGHVQFFTARSFEALVVSSGLEIVDRHRYVPIPSLDTLSFLARKDGLGFARWLGMVATRRLIPLVAGRLWSELYYAHHAVLCRVPAGP